MTKHKINWKKGIKVLGGSVIAILSALMLENLITTSPIMELNWSYQLGIFIGLFIVGAWAFAHGLIKN